MYTSVGKRQGPWLKLDRFVNDCIGDENAMSTAKMMVMELLRVWLQLGCPDRGLLSRIEVQAVA